MAIRHKKNRKFFSGLDEILIIEEKRAFLESHVRNHLYNFRNKPKRIVGKYDENHEKLINENYQLSRLDLKKVIASRIAKTCNKDFSVNKVSLKKNNKISDKNYIPRTPYFCSGCP